MKFFQAEFISAITLLRLLMNLDLRTNMHKTATAFDDDDDDGDYG